MDGKALIYGKTVSCSWCREPIEDEVVYAVTEGERSLKMCVKCAWELRKTLNRILSAAPSRKAK